MNVRRFSRGWALVIIFAGGVRAQPELALRSAVNHLLEAENYSWEESRGIFFDSLKRNASLRPTGSGETEIGGYTTARFRPRQVVVHGSNAAIKLSGGWCLARLMSDEEIEELGRLQWSLPPGAPTGAIDNAVEQPPADPKLAAAAAKRARDYHHALPHEVLQYLLQRAENFRNAGATIAADVAQTQDELGRLEYYLMTGMDRPEVVSSRPIGIRLPGSPARPSPRPGRTLSSAERPVLYVSLDGGAIVEFSVEFSRTGQVSRNGQPAELTPMINVYTTKIFEVGKTKVDVPNEVKTLFNEFAPAR